MNASGLENLAGQDVPCVLTLTAPKALEEELLDLLREQTDLASGFSVLHGYGLGAGLVARIKRVRRSGRLGVPAASASSSHVRWMGRACAGSAARAVVMRESRAMESLRAARIWAARS